MNKTIVDYALKVRIPVTIFIIITAFVITFYVSKPERDGVGNSPNQPINFSHKLHAGQMGIDCKYCHTGVTKSRHAVIPSPSICMNCHSIARKTKPEIIKLTKYFNDGTPIPWKRVHRVPDYVYFNHSVHVNKGIQCASCHGDVARMEKISQVHSFTMSACLDCHRTAQEKMPELAGRIKRGPENCWACHR